MADRIHPTDSPPAESSHFSGNFSSGEFPKKPSPPPSTYVIQLPKDQIYRIPPPENAHRLQYLSRKKPNRSRCRCCICSILAVLLTVLILSGISLSVLYLIYRPQPPQFSVEDFTVSGINLTSSPISPKFNVTVKSRNPNGKIGIYYEKGGLIDVFYNGVVLSNGVLTAFYQPGNNVTVVKTVLVGSTIVLTNGVRKDMRAEVIKKTVPFNVRIKVPVKVKVGSVKTWRFFVNVDCDVTVDNLTGSSKIVSRKCSHDVDFW